MLTVLERSPEGAIVVRRDGTIVYANPAAERLIGKPGRPLVGGAFGVPTLGEGTAVLDLVPTPDDPRVAEMRVVEIQWEGEPAYLAFFRDITGYEELRQEVDRLNREVADSQRRNDEFLAVLAHELRNPLTPILNGLQLMRLADGDEEIRVEARDLVEHQVRNVARLVEDLLAASRARRGEVRLRPEPVDLADLATMAFAAARPAAEARGHRLSLRAAGPIRLRADATWLEQAMAHLLQNAIKYTEPGGAIELSARSDGAEAVVVVRDNGVGIMPEMLPRIFEMFTQEGRSIGRSGGGMGIGLAMVREVAERHGGTVSVDSPGPGRGTAFALRLPLEQARPRADGASDAGSRASGLRVMIVDPNRAATRSLESLVRLWGHEVCAAPDPATGLAVAETYRPHVVLLDLAPPGLDGAAAAGHFRARPCTAAARLVAVGGRSPATGDGRPGTGFDAVLDRPLDVDALAHLLGDAARAV